MSTVDARVRVLAADIGQPAFGLPQDRYAELTRQVGAVVHCAADVSWAAPYEILRGANVVTTQSLLRFACSSVRKPVHFISSVAACYSTCGPSEVEEDETVPDIAGIHLGYAQSKWSAERLVSAAHARGLPTVTYRPALICGHSASGRNNDDDLIALLIRGCAALGHAPALDWRLDACPVDFVARAIARTVREPRCHERLVHLRNARPAHWTEAMLWLDLRGHRIALEPFSDWIERVRREARAPAHPLHRLRAFLLERPAGEGGRYLPELYANPHVPALRTERSDALLQRLGVQCPWLSASLLERYVERWVQGGLLPRAPHADRPKLRPGDECWNAALENALRIYFQEPALELVGSQTHELGADRSILGELASWRSAVGLGLHARRLELVRAGGRRSIIELVLKPREAAQQLIELTAEVAMRCDRELGAAFATHAPASEFADADRRELALYAEAKGALRDRMPVCFGTIDLGGVPVLLLERVPEPTRSDPALPRWDRAGVHAALDGLASVQAQWLGRERQLAALQVRAESAAADSVPAERWLSALSAHARHWFEDWIGNDGVRAQAWLAAHWREGATAARALPHTLVHHDFNPRNLLLRATPLGPRLCAFDWELACYGLPQRDIVELLCFTLDPHNAADAAGHYLEYARLALERASNDAFNAGAWRSGVRFALADFGARRLPLYCIAHRFRPQSFLERVARTWWRLADELGTTP
jgi:thioester reductase-like protein